MQNTMQIIMMKIEDLKPYEHNAKLHPPEQVEQLANSIKQFGMNDPIGIWGKENEIVEGHGRLLACQKLGHKEVPCIRLDHLTDEERRAYALAHNQTTLNSGFDSSLLKIEFGNIPNIDMSLFGFDLSKDKDVEEVDTPEPPAEPKAKRGDTYILGTHRLVCGDSTDPADVQKLMDGKLADLCVTDPPYNVDYGNKADAINKYGYDFSDRRIMNDYMPAVQFIAFLDNAFRNMKTALRPGGAFYIWHASITVYEFEQALRLNELKSRQQLVWVKNAIVLGRQDYQWKHEPCQPAGTMISTPKGLVPIESLKDGDRVISYDKYSGVIKGYKEGLTIKTANREYEGKMYHVFVGDKMTKATDNHKFTIRYRDEKRKIYCVYLMRKGDWWRIGVCETYSSRGFGLKQRMRQELAEESWIIQTFKTRGEAQCGEQLIAIKYGIPYTHWSVERGITDEYIHRTTNQINWIYDNLDLKQLKENAYRLLKENNRNPNIPLITAENRGDKFSCRVTSQIAACNLIPEIMELPIPYTKYNGDKTFEWQPISKVDAIDFKGKVYSLDVEKYKHYIADGIVVHNCLYGWKDGAAHYFTEDRTKPTIIDDQIDLKKLKKGEMLKLLEEILSEKTIASILYEDKPTKSPEHPTMKPVKLMARQIQNSSKPGEIVLDIFGGSGSTLMACEQLQRSCYTMELDPKYIDVIIKRWEDFTGKKAVKI